MAMYSTWYFATYRLQNTWCSETSSSFRPISLISFWTWSHHLLLGHVVSLSPSGALKIMFLIIELYFFLSMCPVQLTNLFSLIWIFTYLADFLQWDLNEIVPHPQGVKSSHYKVIYNFQSAMYSL